MANAAEATPVQTVAFDAKCNHTSALFVGALLVLGTPSGHISGHTRRVFRSVGSKNGTKTRQGDGFFDRRLKRARRNRTSRAQWR